MNLDTVVDNIDLGKLLYPNGFTPKLNTNTNLPAINVQALYFRNNKIYVGMLVYGGATNYQVEINPNGEILEA